MNPNQLQQILKAIVNEFDTKIGVLTEEVKMIKDNVPDLNVVLDHMKGEDGKTPVYGQDWNLSEEEINSIIEKVKPVAGVDYELPKDGKDAVISKELIDRIVSTVQSKVKDGKDGKNGVDGLDGLDGSPDTPKDIKEKLESLKGDKRLSKEAIKGLENVTNKSDLDRAISILDQRTQFLVNKKTISSISDITGTPTEVAYFDLAGNGTSDSEFVRDNTTHESVFGFQTYAQGTVDDGSSQYVDWRADNLGTIGNSITFVFDGIIDTDTALANWNASNPSNTVSVVGGTGNFVPPAGTVLFAGGGQTGYELTRNLLGQGFQFAGSVFSDNSTGISVNGLVNTGSGPSPLLAALDFGNNQQSTFQLSPDIVNGRAENGVTGDVGYFQLDPVNRVQICFDPGDNTGQSGFDMFYHTIRIRNVGYTWDWPTTPGTPGQVLTTKGTGAMMTWETPTAPSPSLKENYIGFGGISNLLTGVDSFQYKPSSYHFSQTFPNNVNNGTALGSPLTFGPATFTGPGVDDLTLTWDAATYKSKKYGGNLTIQVTSTGIPDTITWIYTGPYSEIIGQGTIALSPGLINLSDVNGSTIAEIQFGSTTGHIGGEQWTAGTSLGTLGWGSTVADTYGHTFFKLSGNNGEYYFGDQFNAMNPYLSGNNTSIRINDAIAELGLYAKRYFRIEAPGGLSTLVLADMQTNQWNNYGMFSVRNTSFGQKVFEVDSANNQIQIGDPNGVFSRTNLVVNNTSEVIHANTGGNFAVRTASGNNIFKVDVAGSSITGTDSTGIVGFSLDLFNRNVQVGWAPGGGTNGNYLYIDDANHDSRIVTDGAGYFSVKGGNNLLFQVNTPSGLITSGDISNATTNTKSVVDVPNKQFRFSTGGTDRFIAYEDWTAIGNVLVRSGVQAYTSTGNVTMNNNITTLQYNPASVNATATIDLPTTSGGSGSDVRIVFGGIITSGPVVTALTIAPGSGNTIIDSSAPTTANAGDSFTYTKIGNVWYRVK